MLISEGENLEFMALDQWHPSYDQAARDDEFFVHLDRQCDFYFGFGVDVLEENAVNEKFCREVLNILIAKADTEIGELENFLVNIQSELAWTEYEEWFDICCSTLKENIDHLEKSLKSLSSAGKYEIDVDVLVHRKPAEEAHEIVKALLQKHFIKKDKQPTNVIAQDSSSETPSQTASLNAIVKEEEQELFIEKSPISYYSLKSQEGKTKFLETDQKPKKTVTKHTALEYSSQLAGSYSDKQKLSHTNNLRFTTNNKARRKQSTQDDYGMIQSSIFSPQQKNAKSIKDSGVGAPAAHATENSHEMKKLRIPKFEVDGDNEVTKQCSGTKTSEKLSLPSCYSGGKRCIPKAETAAQTSVKFNNMHASRHADDDGGNEQGSVSRSDSFKVTTNGNFNLEQKVVDISLSLRSYPKSGVEVYPTKADLISSLKTKNSMKDAQKVPESGIINYKLTGLNSMLELQDQTKKDILKPETEEETLVPPLLAVHQAEIAAIGINSNSNMSLKPYSEKAKRKIQSNLPIMLQSSGYLYPNGVDLDLPLSNVKKRQKFVVSYDNICLNQLFPRKILNKPVLPRQDGVTADISIPVKSEKKIVESSRVVPIPLELKSSARDMNIPDSFEEGDKKTKNEVVLRSIGGWKAKDGICVDLDHMKLVELKSIAKHYKLPQYWKLKKKQLANQLSNLLVCKL